MLNTFKGKVRPEDKVVFGNWLDPELLKVNKKEIKKKKEESNEKVMKRNEKEMKERRERKG